jgi:putative Mg2+ transporter-C (MgtC) family protein
MDLPHFVGNTVLSLLLGSIIGAERQWHRRLSDLKTSALVAMGAALFMMVASTPAGWSDPMRMASQIVMGVGFIGGGLLFRQGGQAHGINTAATLWCSAAIGVLCGFGRSLEAVVAAMLLVGANLTLRNAARRLQLRMGLGDNAAEQVAFDVSCAPSRAGQVRESLERALLVRHGDLHAVTQTRDADGTAVLGAVVAFEDADLHVIIADLVAEIRQWDVVSVSWRRL